MIASSLPFPTRTGRTPLGAAVAEWSDWKLKMKDLAQSFTKVVVAESVLPERLHR